MKWCATYSKSKHGNASYEELILLGETETTRCTEDAILSLALSTKSSTSLVLLSTLVLRFNGMLTVGKMTVKYSTVEPRKVETRTN